MTKNTQKIADHNEVPGDDGGLNSDIQDPPEYNAENDKQSNAAYPTSHAGRMGTGNIARVTSTSTDGDYQTASHSTGYTDQLGSADWLGGPQNGSEIPGNGGNGVNGGNGDETSVGNAYWQFFSDPTIKAKIKTIVDQADIPKTVVDQDLSQAPLREVLSQNSGDQRNWVLTDGWLGLVKGLSQVMNVPPCPTENSPKTLSAWLGDAGLGPWLSSPAQYDEPLGNVIQWPLLGYSFPWFQPA